MIYILVNRSIYLIDPVFLFACVSFAEEVASAWLRKFAIVINLWKSFFTWWFYFFREFILLVIVIILLFHLILMNLLKCSEVFNFSWIFRSHLLLFTHYIAFSLCSWIELFKFFQCSLLASNNLIILYSRLPIKLWYFIHTRPYKLILFNFQLLNLFIPAECHTLS